jgi:hypothetical protein
VGVCHHRLAVSGVRAIGQRGTVQSQRKHVVGCGNRATAPGGRAAAYLPPVMGAYAPFGLSFPFARSTSSSKALRTTGSAAGLKRLPLSALAAPCSTVAARCGGGKPRVKKAMAVFDGTIMTFSNCFHPIWIMDMYAAAGASFLTCDGGGYAVRACVGAWARDSSLPVSRLDEVELLLGDSSHSPG